MWGLPCHCSGAGGGRPSAPARRRPRRVDRLRGPVHSGARSWSSRARRPGARATSAAAELSSTASRTGPGLARQQAAGRRPRCRPASPPRSASTRHQRRGRRPAGRRSSSVTLPSRTDPHLGRWRWWSARPGRRRRGRPARTSAALGEDARDDRRHPRVARRPTAWARTWAGLVSGPRKLNAVADAQLARAAARHVAQRRVERHREAEGDAGLLGDLAPPARRSGPG